MYNPTTGEKFSDAERDAYFYAVWGFMGAVFPYLSLDEWIFFQMKMLAERKKDDKTN